MRFNRSLCALFAGLGASLLLPACSESDEDPGLAVSELSDEYVGAVCGALDECLGEYTGFLLEGGDCASEFGPSFTDALSDLQMLIDAGRVQYDGKKAEECIAQAATLGCGIFEQAADVCDEAVQGTVQAGGDCNQDLECQGDAYCAFDGMCPGTCSTQGLAEASCESDEDCAGALGCFGGSCAAAATDGGQCGGSSGTQCRLGLFCMGEDEETGTAGSCVPLDDVFTVDLGGACDFETGMLCKPGLSCVVASVGASGPVLECQQRAATDAACRWGAPSSCQDGQYCNADIELGQVEGVCVDLPGEGESCVEIGTCQAGLTCNSSDVCRAPGRIGDSCSEDWDCASDVCAGGECSAGYGCDI